MEEGVRAVCLRLWLEGRLDGVLCLGGAEEPSWERPRCTRSRSASRS